MKGYSLVLWGGGSCAAAILVASMQFNWAKLLNLLLIISCSVAGNVEERRCRKNVQALILRIKEHSESVDSANMGHATAEHWLANPRHLARAREFANDNTPAPAHARAQSPERTAA
jgi:hypothetical protein